MAKRAKTKIYAAFLGHMQKDCHGSRSLFKQILLSKIRYMKQYGTILFASLYWFLSCRIGNVEEIIKKDKKVVWEIVKILIKIVRQLTKIFNTNLISHK